MTNAELLEYLRRGKHAVQASSAKSGAPQAAIVGVAVTDALEVFFDTLDSTRKCANLRRDPRVAFVFGTDTDAWTVQYEGVADEPKGAELDRLLALYLAKFPDGRERQSWPGITYFRVRPTWIRFSDYRGAQPLIVEKVVGIAPRA